MATPLCILMSVGRLYVPPRVTLKDLDRALALDDGEFKESEHPRDKSGKFAEGAGSGGGGHALTAPEKSYIVNSHVGLIIKNAGFKKAKTEDGTLLFQHPSGAKVVIHPPASGKKSSSKWTHHDPSNKDLSGSGEGIALAKVLGVAVKKAEAKKEEKAAPAGGAPSLQPAAPVKPGETVPAALLKHRNPNGAVNMKAYMADMGYPQFATVKPAIEPGDHAIYRWSKPDGAKVELNGTTGEWLVATPGFATKKGNGSANLAKLLAGGKAEQVGGAWTWENTPDKSLAKSPEEAAAAAKQQAAQAAAKAAGEAEAAKEMESKKASNKTMKTLIEAAPPHTSEEAGAVGMYTDGSYKSMNEKLRGGGKLAGASKTLNDWLMKAEFPEDVVLWRKVDGDYASILKSVLGVGAKFYEKGFSSTSTHATSWHGSLHLKINVKKGQKGAAVKHLSGHSGENEVVLPANTAYVVKAYDPESHEVEVEVDQSHLK